MSEKYPVKFYRKDGKVLKRESDITGIVVEIPENGKSLPLIHTPVIYPSKQRMDSDITSMKEVDQKEYESFLSAFYHAADSNRKVWLDYRNRQVQQAIKESNPDNK